MKAHELDTAFDEGADIGGEFDWGRATRPNCEQRKIDLDLPAWMASGLEREALRLGVPREALIKLWIAEHIRS